MKRVNFLNGLGLFIVSIILLLLVTPWAIFIGIYLAIKYKFKSFGPYFGRLLKTIAIIIDIFGNVVFGPVLNYVFITEHSKFKFGSWRNTISEVLGINEWAKTLTKKGVKMVEILDFIDENHCFNAIQEHNFKDIKNGRLKQ